MANSFSDDRSLPPFMRAAQNNKQPAAHSNAAQAADCYGVAEHDARAFGFKIFFANGTISGIFYHDVVSPMKFDGNGEIVITLVTFQIRITGNNLKGLFDYFFDHSVSWIKEQDASFSLAGDEAEIETVKIEENGS